MNEPDGDERFLEVMLEERLGGLRAPDLRHRVLAAPAGQRQAAARRARAAVPGGRSGWVVAAALLLGLVVTIAVRLLDAPGDGASPAGHGPVLPARGGPDQDRKLAEGLVRPASKAEFLGHLQSMRAFTVRALTTRRHSHTFRGDEPAAVVRIEGAALGPLRKLFATGLRPALPAGWIWPNRIRFELPDGRFMLGAYYTLGDPPLFAVSGIGNWAVTPELAAAVRPLVAEAERIARMREGVVFSRADLVERVGGIPSHVRQLTCYALADADLELLGRFGNLEILDLRGCARTLTGAGFVHLAGLSSVRRILLHNTAIDDPALARLGDLPNLDQLDLRYASRITGAGLRSFGAAQKLRRLDLSLVARLDDDGLAAAAAIPSLRHLDLSGRQLGRVTAAGLLQLQQATGLESLDLSDCPLDLDAGLPGLGNLRRLAVLDLSDTSVGPDGWAALQFIQEPNGALAEAALRTLHLRRCRSTDDAALQRIAAYRRLQDLDLTGCDRLTAAGLLHLTRLVHLRRLVLRQVPLTAAGCKHLSTLPALDHLDLGFTGVDDDGLARIAGLRSVTELVLTGNHRITDVGLDRLAALRQLTRLELNVCEGITAAGVRRLRAALPACELQVPDAFGK